MLMDERYQKILKYYQKEYGNDKPSDITEQEPVLAFYNKKLSPSITLEFYLSRLTRYGNLTPNMLLMIIILMNRFKVKYDINKYNFFRVVLIATFIVMKLADDEIPGVKYMAHLGGVSNRCDEIIALELMFLEVIEWELSMTVDEVKAMALEILESN